MTLVEMNATHVFGLRNVGIASSVARHIEESEHLAELVSNTSRNSGIDVAVLSLFVRTCHAVLFAPGCRKILPSRPCSNGKERRSDGYLRQCFNADALHRQLVRPGFLKVLLTQVPTCLDKRNHRVRLIGKSQEPCAVRFLNAD